MPWPLLLMMTVLTGSPSVKQVASSWLFMANEPSPSVLTTSLPGFRRWAPHAGLAPHARVLEPVVLRRPHLVLADAGDDERLAAGDVRDLLHHILRLDDVVAPLVAEGEVALPLGDLRRPLLARLVDSGRRPTAHLLPQRLHQLREHAAAVAHDRHAHLDVFRDRGRIDVDVDDLGVRRERVDLAG